MIESGNDRNQRTNHRTSASWLSGDEGDAKPLLLQLAGSDLQARVGGLTTALPTLRDNTYGKITKLCSSAAGTVRLSCSSTRA